MNGDQNPSNLPTPRQRRSPFLTFLMVLGGIILLLPGLCAVIFVTGSGGGADPGLSLLWLICFVVSALGVILIAKAFH
jgi:hypothetical protein